MPVVVQDVADDAVQTTKAETGTDKSQPSNEPFNEQTKYVAKSKIITIFLACASIDMLSLIDQTSLTVALPIIGADLNAGSRSIWIANGYSITSTSFQLLYGRLSDIWSRKLVILTGLPIFFIGSLASSQATSLVQLIVFRAISGIGGGGLLTLAQIIVSDVVTLRDRGKYQGILGACAGIANGIGPVVGGVIAEQSKDSWRWIFRLIMFLCIFATLAVVFFMPLRRVEGSKLEKLKAIDFFGAFLSLVGTALICTGLTWAGGEYSWGSAHVLATFIIGLAVFALFVLWQWKGARYPVIPLHIFKHSMVIGACLSTFFHGWLFFTQVFYIPTFYQLLAGYSPLVAGALSVPLTLAHTVSSTIAGLLITWTGRYRELILLGWGLWAISSGLWSTLDGDSGLGKYIGYSILMGLGVGQTLQPVLVGAQAAVPRRDMAVVTATRNFSRQLGGSFGLAIGTAILNNALRSSISRTQPSASAAAIRAAFNDPIGVLKPHSPGATPEGTVAALSISADALREGYREGFHTLFHVNTGLAVASFALSWFLIRHVSVDRKDDVVLKEKEAEREKEKTQQRQAAGKAVEETA